jgi:hypothetical protein
VVFDAQDPAPGIPPGVAGIASSKLTWSDATPRAISGDYTSGAIHERVTGRIWPAGENHLVTLELHH